MNIMNVIRKVRSKSRIEIESFLRWRLLDIASQLFWLPAFVTGPIVRVFRPDSFWVYGLHSEYQELHRRFTAHNFLNRGDTGRLTAFILNIKQVLGDDVKGDFAELGVWRGNTAAILAHYARKAGRRAIFFDTFEGFSIKDLKGVDSGKKQIFNDTSIALVASVVGSDSAVEYAKGYFPDTVTDEHKDHRYAVVSLDCDLYVPMKAGLDFFYPRMNRGAIFLLHDYSSGVWDGAKRAIDEFCSATGEYPVLMPDKSGSAFIRKSRQIELSH